MARPKKTGLDYFPLDVEFDDKVKAVEMLHGNNGLVWVLKIWQAAYKTLTGEVNLSGLFGELHAKNCRITTEEHHNILKTSLEIELFETIDNGFITSNGIKKRISLVSNDRETAIIRQKSKYKDIKDKDIKDKDIKDKDIKDKDKYKVKETPHYSENNDRITTEELEKTEMESERSAEEERKEEEHKTKKDVFKIPSVEEIEEYCKERKNGVSANKFYDFYESKGWYVGKNKMKSWKAAIRTWEGNTQNETKKEFDPYRGVVAK